MRDENGWGDDKYPRKQMIAENYRIIFQLANEDQKEKVKADIMLLFEMDNSVPICYVDMDGVLADFYNPFNKCSRKIIKYRK